MEWAIAGMVSVVAGLVGPGLSSFDTPMERWISNGSRVVHVARVARIAIVLYVCLLLPLSEWSGSLRIARWVSGGGGGLRTQERICTTSL